MTDRHRRYLAVEVVIGAGINALLSLAFALVVFHGRARVAVPDLVFDALPQRFMVTLMSMVVPSLLTRRRIATGAAERWPGAGRSLPGSIVSRAIALAILVAILSWAAQRLMLPALLPGPPRFAAMVAAKTLYGAVLGAVVTAAAVRIALAQR